MIGGMAVLDWAGQGEEEFIRVGDVVVTQAANGVLGPRFLNIKVLFANFLH
ncbi:hypothetical protein D3C81_1260880 [compost metagenome]